MSIHALKHEVSHLYHDQPGVLKTILSGTPTSGILCSIRQMEVFVWPAWLRTSDLLSARRVALGFVNGIWTLCIAPKNIQTNIPEFITTPWSEKGSLIHLAITDDNGMIERLNTILLAITISEQMWKTFLKQEPTCVTLTYKKYRASDFE